MAAIGSHMGVLIHGHGSGIASPTASIRAETQIRLQAGESITLGDFEMRFNSVSRFPRADDLLITKAGVDLFKNGKLRTLTPQIELYQRTGQPVTIPSGRLDHYRNFYVILVNWEPTTAKRGHVPHLPETCLINWIWTGGLRCSSWAR